MKTTKYSQQSFVRRIWRFCGRIIYWVGWPGIYIILRTQPPRTRVVLFYNGKILLIKDWMGAGSWTLPGGGLYQQEQAAVGASRELFEETGMRLQPKALQSLGEFKVRSHGIPVTIIGYTAILTQKPQIHLRGIEVAEFCWVKPQEIKNMFLSNTAIAPIREALHSNSKLQ